MTKCSGAGCVKSACVSTALLLMPTTTALLLRVLKDLNMPMSFWDGPILEPGVPGWVHATQVVIVGSSHDQCADSTLCSIKGSHTCRRSTPWFRGRMHTHKNKSPPVSIVKLSQRKYTYGGGEGGVRWLWFAVQEILLLPTDDFDH